VSAACTTTFEIAQAAIVQSIDPAVAFLTIGESQTDRAWGQHIKFTDTVDARNKEPATPALIGHTAPLFDERMMVPQW
jgi:hypothetical protein